MKSARPADEALAPKRELMRTLLRYRREFYLAAVFSAGVNLLMLTPTLYMLQVYDRVMVSQNEYTLIAVSVITVALFGLMALCEWARSRLLVSTGLRLDDDLSSRVFNATFDHRLASANAPGARPQRSFSDLLLLRQFITGNGAFAFFDLPWVPIYLVVMFVLHPVLGWASLIFALVQMAMAGFGHQRTLRPTEAAQQAQTDEFQFVQGKLRNAEVVESMGMLGNLQRRWAQRHGATLHHHGQAHGLTHRIMALSKFLRYAQQSASLGLGALLVIKGELSPGAMIAANVLMSRALAPIDTTVTTWKGFIMAREAFKRLSGLLDSHPDRDSTISPGTLKGHVLLRDLVATAPGRPVPILNGLDLEVRPGTVLVVMGPSGSGKSTLARVMLGIWTDVKGDAWLDGQPVHRMDRAALGPQVGYLPQDVELFEGTIGENIARLGHMDPPAVIAAAKAAGVHEMILRFPRGYETPMGEAGGLLSGGQRQRLALARALYGQPAFLVLDEPNANLDDAGEHALAAAVKQAKAQGSTVVLISHRPDVLAVADELLILRDGRVHAYGLRDAVLNQLRQPLQAQHAPPSASLPPAASATV
jgi:ATP-binding cassette subfamily C exporter for protease/lipase